MDDTERQRSRETAEEALRLIREIDAVYTSRLKVILDAEVFALLEALKMFHADGEKKLSDYLRVLDG